MMRQRTVMLREPRGKERLDRLARPLMQSPATFEQQRVVGDLLRERMLKGVLRLWKGGLLVDELRRPQVRQELLQLVFGLLYHTRQQAQGKLFADHRQGLEQRLLLGRQPVDA